MLFGAAVIGIGFLIANVISKFVGTGSLQGMIIRYATMLIFTFMGLRQMNIGDDIVTIGFGALMACLAVAGSLAFGLGGRDWAAKKLEEMDKK